MPAAALATMISANSSQDHGLRQAVLDGYPTNSYFMPECIFISKIHYFIIWLCSFFIHTIFQLFYFLVVIEETGMGTSIEQSHGNKPRDNVNNGNNRVPMFIHITADQVNEKQEAANAKYRFSQNVYVNLNSACDFSAMTKLITFFIFILIWNCKLRLSQQKKNYIIIF